MAVQQRKSAAASRRKSPAKPARSKQPKQAAQQAKQAPSSNKGQDGLTDQQRQFYRAYKLTHNGTQAAIEAGYSPATAQQQASRLLRHVVIKTMLEQDAADDRAKHEQQITQALAEFDISPRSILRELARIAFFDIRKLYNPDGSVKGIHQLDDDTAAALTGIDVQILYGGSGDDRGPIGTVVKWKASSKDKALDMLAKHKNLYAADNDGKVQPFAEALAGFIGQMHSTGGSKLPIRPPAERRA